MSETRIDTMRRLSKGSPNCTLESMATSISMTVLSEDTSLELEIFFPNNYTLRLAITYHLRSPSEFCEKPG